jgi:hypothetical protein
MVSAEDIGGEEFLKYLWKLLNVIWRKGKAPSCLQKAKGCFIPNKTK